MSFDPPAEKRYEDPEAAQTADDWSHYGYTLDYQTLFAELDQYGQV